MWAPWATTYRFYVNARMPRTKSLRCSETMKWSFGHQHAGRHLQRRLQQLLECIGHQRLPSSDSSQIWNTTATPPLVLKDLLLVLPGAEDPSLVQDASFSPTLSGFFQAGGTQLEREHIDRCLLVRVEHCCQRPSRRRRTLVDCPNHHNRFHFRNFELPNFPAWETVRTSSSSRS